VRDELQNLKYAYLNQVCQIKQTLKWDRQIFFHKNISADKQTELSLKIKFIRRATEKILFSKWQSKKYN